MEKLCKKTKEIEEDENVLKIGYLRGYLGKEVEETITSFSTLYPNVSIQLKRGTHEELHEYLVSGEASLIINDQRRVFHEDYVNYHLLHLDCYVEISNQNPLSQKEYVDVDELKKETCILVANDSQREIEQGFYENIIGLKSHYLFVEGMEEAKLLVAINRGFMPIEYAKKPSDNREYVRSIPLYRNNQPLHRNYCAFWKKDRSNYYIEEFADLLRQKMRESHQE